MANSKNYSKQKTPFDFIHNPKRLAALRKVALLDTPTEESFDRLSQLAACFTSSPIALVSLVDLDRQFFKSCFGLPEPWKSMRETPLSHSFCKHNHKAGVPLVVNDARTHPVLKDNPAIKDLNVIAYLGVPLVTHDNYVLGSFCVIDSKPRLWAQEEVEIIKSLAASVMTEIDLRTEVAERKKTEQELRRAEEDYRMLYKEAPVMIHSIDSSGNLVMVSDFWLSVFGYTREEIIGTKSVNILTEESREMAINVYMPEFYKKGVIYNVPYQMVTKDSKVIDVLLSAISKKNSKGEIVQTWVFSIDVTEKVRAEKALAESEEKFRLLFELSKDPIVFVDENGNFLDMNDAYNEMTGYSKAELLGMHAGEIWKSPEERTAWEAMMREYGHVHDYECKQKRKDGAELDILFTSSIRKEKDGSSVYQSICRDVTARKLIESEREELINELKQNLLEIKTLRGLLPICAECKKIRDDQGYWNQIEVYISDHSDAEFSHGICPECIEKLYPKFDFEEK